MFKAAFLVPFLALIGLLTFSAPASAANAMAFGRSPAASRFGSNDTVIRTRSLFGGRKTVTQYAADGTSRSIIQTRRFFGGKNIRVTDRSAFGQTVFDSKTKTTRGGDTLKGSSVAWNRDGSQTRTTERRTFFGRLKRDTVTISSGGERTGRTVEKFRGNGTMVKSTTTDANGTTVEKFRRSGTIKKATATDSSGKFVAKFDRAGRLTNEQSFPK